MKRIVFIQIIAGLFLASCSSHKHVLNCPHYDNFPTAKAIADPSDQKSSNETSISNPLDDENYPVSADLRSSITELELIDNKPELQATQETKTHTSAIAFEKSEAVVIADRKVSRKELKRELKKQVVDQQNNPKGNPRGLAIASLVTGIVSLFIMGIPLGILAIVFGAISAGKLEKGEGRGMAIAGLVLGIIGILGALIVLATLA
tara:strand:- start:350 stop:964 length:615 start_codon:yes stop_codon:yes gene_type:complete